MEYKKKKTSKLRNTKEAWPTKRPGFTLPHSRRPFSSLQSSLLKTFKSDGFYFQNNYVSLKLHWNKINGLNASPDIWFFFFFLQLFNVCSDWNEICFGPPCTLQLGGKQVHTENWVLFSYLYEFCEYRPKYLQESRHIGRAEYVYIRM